MERKIAVLADIHGNYSALKAVLSKIDEDPKIEHIYCLGDMIGIGYQTNEVLELLTTHKNISFVMGNHDEAIIDILSGRDPYSKGSEKEHHKWLASRIHHKYVPFLAELPITLRANYNGIQFLFLHYHLKEQNEFMQVDKDPTEKKLDDLYQSSDANVICFGHHHIIHHFKTTERLYLNPSSLGCNNKPLAPFLLIKIGENSEIETSFLEVPYDNKGFLLGYKNLNVPDSDFILQVFHGNQHLKYAYKPYVQ
ncbi:MAG: metallophosphoesterase family protein [Bacillota bacterium]|nr:metallophosphoesterase family protein [Bacillota bacterium]